MNLTFTPATRERSWARIGLQGPPGCGKTMSSLRIAEGLAQGGDIGLADTERETARKYAPVPGRPDLGGHAFLHMPIRDYDPRNLIHVVEVAEHAGIAVLIVDSWSHFWNGRGGLLELVEQSGAERGGGSFGGWRTGNQIEQRMLDALLNFRGHLIVTMRTKGDYLMEDGPRGKKVTKVGIKPVQREGIEYELDVVMDMVEGTAQVTKSRYQPLDGMTFHHPGEDIGSTILDQLGQGIDPVQEMLRRALDASLTYQQARELHMEAGHRRMLEEPVSDPGIEGPSTIGMVIARRGEELKRAMEEAAAKSNTARGEATPPPTAPNTGPDGAASQPTGARTARPSTVKAKRELSNAQAEVYAAAESIGMTDRDVDHQFLNSYGHGIAEGTVAELHEARDLLLKGKAA